MLLSVCRRCALAVSLLFSLFGCASAAEEAAPAQGFAIEHVTVLTMVADGTPLNDATVVVRSGRIAAVGPSRSTPLPRGVQRIDGRGKWLMPGLSDMHVHILNRAPRAGRPEIPANVVRTQDLVLPFIANGVTQVLDMGSVPETIAQRDEIDSGAALGPHIAVAAMLDGSPPVWAGSTRVAAAPEEGRRAVRDIKAAGFDFVKVYSRLNLETYDAILQEARAQGIRVIGHLPDAARGRHEAALVPGMALVAHAEEYAKQSPDLTDADIARFASLARASGTWVTPTLVTMIWIARQTRDPAAVASVPELGYVHPLLVSQWLHANRYVQSATPERALRFDRFAEFHGRLVRAFAAAGVPMMPGTDAVIPGIVYGFSLHDELRLLAQAGVSNARVLESATRLAAEFLGVAADRGTIEIGKAADLVLLDADPLADIAHTRRIAAVALGGRYLPRAELDAMMEDLARRYKSMEFPRRAAASSAAPGGHDDD